MAALDHSPDIMEYLEKWGNWKSPRNVGFGDVAAPPGRPEEFMLERIIFMSFYARSF